MSKIKEVFKSFLPHLGIMLGITALFIIGVFYIYLPSYTNHGETITVPDLEGYDINEIEAFLESRNLRYEVTPDSGYTVEMEPFTVMKQCQKPGARVKESRKIFITLNAKKAPIISMPQLVGNPLRNAQELMFTYGLKTGDIKWIPDLAKNAVLEQRFRGRKIEPGTELPKGSVIDLIVGNGLGNQKLDMPEVLGMDEKEAEFLLGGYGLKINNINYIEVDSVPQGTILRQSPPAGSSSRVGDLVDIYVAKYKEGLTPEDIDL